jgi:HEAT repeat protein
MMGKDREKDMMVVRPGLQNIRQQALKKLGAAVLSGAAMLLLASLQPGIALAQGNTAERLNRDRFARLAFAQDDKDAGQAAQSLRKGRDLIEEEKWQEAAQNFTDFVSKYPQHKSVDAAMYWLAFSLKKQGRLRDADQALERLIKEYPKSSWKDDARTMRVEMAAQLGNQAAINQALEANNGKSDDELTMVALQSLVFSDPGQALPKLKRMLEPGSSSSRKMQQTAIMLLAQSGARGTDTLLDVARNHQEKEVRRTAIFWLSQSNEERVFDLLKELATTAEDKQISDSAIQGLGQSRNARARALLSELARSAPSTETRRAAILSLAIHGGESSVDELLGLYDSESNQELKKQLLLALFMSNKPRARMKLLEVARREPNAELRKASILWVAQGGSEQTIAMLAELYDGEANAGVKEQLIMAMGLSRNKAALRKLMEIAKNSPSVELRKKAIFWLGQSNDPEAMKFIEDILK